MPTLTLTWPYPNPHQVCCTQDYCAMRDGSVRFTHLAHADGHFLLRCAEREREREL